MKATKPDIYGLPFEVYGENRCTCGQVTLAQQQVVENSNGNDESIVDHIGAKETVALSSSLDKEGEVTRNRKCAEPTKAKFRGSQRAASKKASAAVKLIPW